MIAPSAINDTVLLLAELMENATTFSPPHLRVTVTALAHPGRVTIVDHGIGLSPERLNEENARLAQRERLDLAPTEVLGLFVVGRLARRHNLGVVLTNTPGGGVTVTVDIADVLISGGPATTAPPIGPPASTPELPPVKRPAPAQDLVHADNGSRGMHSLDYDDEISLIDDAYGLFDLPSLDRATRAIEAGRPWNAFELPQPALTAGPVRPEAPAEPKVRLEWTAADTGPLPTVQPAAAPPPMPSQSPAPLPRRAEWSPPHQGIPASRPGSAPSIDDDTQTIVMPTVRGGLTRRVPGATIRMDQPAATRQNVRPQDPDEVWDLVQQFESGVARAMDEVKSEPGDSARSATRDSARSATRESARSATREEDATR
jgi:hypothetical protein